MVAECIFWLMKAQERNVECLGIGSSNVPDAEHPPTTGLLALQLTKKPLGCYTMLSRDCPTCKYTPSPRVLN